MKIKEQRKTYLYLHSKLELYTFTLIIL